MDYKLSEVVLFHRKKSALTRNRLADPAGAGKTVIFDIENGKETIRFSIMEKVLNVLNIEITFTSPLMGKLLQITSSPHLDM